MDNGFLFALNKVRAGLISRGVAVVCNEGCFLGVGNCVARVVIMVS